MTFSSDCECLGKANPTYSVKQKLSKTEQGALPNMTYDLSDELLIFRADIIPVSQLGDSVPGCTSSRVHLTPSFRALLVPL